MFSGSFSRKRLERYLEKLISELSAKTFTQNQIMKMINKYILNYGLNRIPEYILKKRMFPIIYYHLIKEGGKVIYSIYRKVGFQGNFEAFEKDFLGFCFDHYDEMVQLESIGDFRTRYFEWVDNFNFPQGNDKRTQFGELYLKLKMKLTLEDTDYLTTKIELNRLNDSYPPKAKSIDPFYLNLLEMDELVWEKILPNITTDRRLKSMLDDFVPFDHWNLPGKSFYEIIIERFKKLKNNKRFLFSSDYFGKSFPTYKKEIEDIRQKFNKKESVNYIG